MSRPVRRRHHRRQRQPLPEAAGWVGAVQKQPADATRRKHDATGVDHQRAVRVRREHAGEEHGQLDGGAGEVAAVGGDEHVAGARGGGLVGAAADDGEVGALDGVIAEQAAKRRMRLVGLGDDEETRGAGIQPMHDAGPERAAGRSGGVRVGAAVMRTLVRTVCTSVHTSVKTLSGKRPPLAASVSWFPSSATVPCSRTIT